MKDTRTGRLDPGRARHAPLAMAALAMVVCLMGAEPATHARFARTIQSSGPADAVLQIHEPAAGAAVVGDTPIRVGVVPEASAAQVVVFVDGRELCTLVRPLWSCRWDAGRDVREHHVRVVATLADGRRLVANRRTGGLDVSEAVNVTAVQVPVVVTDARGRYVRGLKPEAFNVLEDGKRQRVDTLIDESLPLEIAAAVDISASMEGAMPEVQAAVRRLFGRLRPGDTTTLVGFNDTMFVLAEKEGDAALREAAVDGLVPWGGTAFYDATVKMLELTNGQTGRRGIIVFSDGDDRHSVGRRDESLARIEEGQVVIYTVGFGEGTSARFRETLKAFAEASGGRAFFPRRPAELDEAFEAIFDELSHQYILSFVSDAPGGSGWRKLEITACDGCRVRAREGYRVPEP